MTATSRHDALVVRPAPPSWQARAGSFLSTAGHEMTTAVLPGFVLPLHRSAPLVLCLMEAAGFAAHGTGRMVGARLGASPGRRRAISALGHLAIGLCCGALALAASVGQVFGLRVGSWASRGFRGPIRLGQALESADVSRAGWAVARERRVGHAGAALGALVACVLLFVLPIKAVIGLAFLPAVAGAVITLVRPRDRTEPAAPRPPAPPVTTSRFAGPARLRWHLVCVAAFQLSNLAVVLLLLRATNLLGGTFGSVQLMQMVALLYVVHLLGAAVVAVPAGRFVDRAGPGAVMAASATVLLGAYSGLAFLPSGAVAGVAVSFVLSGAALGAMEGAQVAGVAHYAPPAMLWQGIGAVTALQSVGRALATLIAGVLWTVISPAVGMLYCGPLLAATAAIALGVAYVSRTPDPQRLSPRVG